jgi:hypothetical protein
MAKDKVKKFLRGAAPYFLVFALMFTVLGIGAVLEPHHVYASDTFPTDAQVGSNASNGIKDITSELKKWIMNLRIVGAVLAVIGIIIGAIIFSISMGNAQKRSIGIGAILSAIIGIIIIAKAPTLADYFISASTTAAK